ncbi:MAG: CPBP family glutamic-type intramembrane protease [Candidatus Acidiferrales bacterium]
MMEAAKVRQMNVAGAALLWTGLLLLGVMLGNWRGFGGRPFAAAMAAAAVLLAWHLFPAARGVKEWLGAKLSGNGALLAPLVPLVAYVFYAALALGIDWRRMLVAAAYVLVPSALARISRGKPAGTVFDYLALLSIWLPVESRKLHWLWPYPPPLTHTLTILLALSTAIAAFIFVRRLEGIGYAAEWKRGSAFALGFNFLIFTAIAIPFGEKIGFIHFAPSLERLRSLPLAATGVLFFTAWPEEFLFRGLVQNLLTRTLRNEWAGLIVASVIFGFTHILHAPFPNWKYVLLATIAGFFYGRAWIKTGSLLPGCFIHASVDTLWHLLFK